jgi:regulatory protein
VVWRKKFGAPGEDASARVRQMRFLAGRGFSADVVRRVVQARSADDAHAFEVDSA